MTMTIDPALAPPDDGADLGLYSLGAPGMPGAGRDFLEHAAALMRSGSGVKSPVSQDILEELHRRALREPGFTMPIQVKPGVYKTVSFVPGHIWGQHKDDYLGGACKPVDGPHPADVLVLGKMPGRQEVQDGRCMVGESGAILIGVLRALHIPDTEKWYITNLLKFQPPNKSGVLTTRWIDDCLPLLEQELRIVRPKFILCLGADASKALLGKKFNVSAMEGRVAEHTYTLSADPATPQERQVRKTALVMTCLHPASVARSPEQRRVLERGLERFGMLLRGVRFDHGERDLDHRVIRTLEELEELLREIDGDPEKTDRWISVDAEWQGEHPVNAGSYIRTLQFGWRPKHAAAIVVRDTRGQPCFFDRDGQDAFPRARDAINAFFVDKRVCGHFLVADLEWLTRHGFDQIAQSFAVPIYDAAFDALDPELQALYARDGWGPGDAISAFMRTRHEGGHDTGLAAHAIEETAMLGLETLMTRYTDCPRYDLPLENWKVAYCREHGIKAKDLEGYGPIDDGVLLPYAIYDADATLRLMYDQQPRLDCDYEGNCCREAFWESMLTVPVILEMHQTGVLVSRRRIDYFTRIFIEARARQEKMIQDWARWPTFNIRSLLQVREFLFGERYNGKRTPAGEVVRLRPPGAISLQVEPLLDTSKPPVPWRRIKEQNEEDEHTPGTGKSILGAMVQDYEAESTQLGWVRDHRFLDQVLKSILRVPKTGDEGRIVESAYSEADDFDGGSDNLMGMVYERGLASVICDDGRVRTHFYPTTETARWRSARPNMQNISKRRDADYGRLLGDLYQYKLRSILYAAPGCFLVEADFKSAELYGVAIMSGDASLLEHCRRNQLAEDAPDYYDIHSHVAVVAFHLDCPATKKGLKSIDKSSLRVAAKNVIFGICYGRGAKAIALQCKEEGNPIAEREAQKIIDTIFTIYPGLVAFFDAARKRTIEDGWMCSCFGRYRRFPETEDRALLGELERQGMNFPIQSMVASAMDRALAYMRDYRDRVLGDPTLFKFLLQIHDAVLLEVPAGNVDAVVNDILPACMTDRVSIYPCTLDGAPTGAGPYRMGVDISVYKNWGESLTREQCRAQGLDERHAH